MKYKEISWYATGMIVPSIIIILTMIFLSFFVLIPYFEQNMIEQKKEKIKEIVNSFNGVLSELDKQVINEVKTKEQAQNEAINLINKLRYGKDRKDYLWVSDKYPKVIMHPYRKDLCNKDVSNFEDPNGKKLFVEFIEVVKQKKEGGYVDYMWQWKNDSSRIVPKLSFVKEFKAWEWIIGTGIYLEDVKAEINVFSQNIIKVLIVVLILISILVYYLIKKGVNSHKLVLKQNKILKHREKKLKSINIKLSSQNNEYLILNKELKKSEEELKVMNDELIISKEKADESDKLKTSFLNNMSHEIRTPLNAIHGFADLLSQEKPLHKKQHDYISIIKNSSNQLVDIVSDILTISYLETGQEKLNISEVCVDDIITILLKQFKQQIIDKNLIFKQKNSSKQKLLILTDKVKLTQILSNLLSNAIKFTKNGFIEFSYNIKGNCIEFYVKDTGIGIKKEYHDIIFKHFRQIELNLSKQYSGTGLGLSISKGFVELLRGQIWLESIAKEGSTFYFTIPYKANKSIEPEIDLSVKTKKRIKTILIAEDEKYNFLYLKELLNDSNLNIIHAHNGKEAVNLFKSREDIDLILMDIKMPILNGYEAAKIIKKQNKNIPIIAQTAYASSDEQEKFNNFFDEYLTKPIKKAELKQILQKYVSQF